jgi:NAD(P)-dependent dehydrogenase (short-subunit alcohol dehydrogenase family)
MTEQIVIVTGALGDFGRLSANAVAHGGHTVYAAMRETAGRNAPQARDVQAYAHEEGVDLRAIELDAGSQDSVDRAIAAIIAEHGRIDVVVHNAGRMAFGPAEAFTTEQFAELFDANVLSSQRVNRAALPHMRRRGGGLLIWVSASSTAGGTPPYLSPYVAAKAAMDAIAVQYARELARWGIETSIVVPGAFARGAAPFAHADGPADQARAMEYAVGPTAGLDTEIRTAFSRTLPDEADPAIVAGAIAGLVDTPFGERPFRIHVDPGDDGAAVAFAVIDRVRAEMLHRVGLPDLLKPASWRPQ